MKKGLFYFLIVLFIALGFYFKPYFSLFYFQSDYNKSAINIETDGNIDDIYVCYNKNCAVVKYKNNIYSNKLNEENMYLHKDKINEVEIAAKDFSKIKAISVFSGFKLKYYDKKDIQNFTKKEFDYDGYSVVSLDGLNFEKNLVQKLGIYLLSPFYCWYFYIFLYILLIFKMPNIKIKYPLAAILLFGGFLRLSHINFIPLWNDELYSLCVMSDFGKNILNNIMNDPGNPPLFFVFSNIWLHFFNKNVILVRLLPALIGIAQIWSIYYIVNKVLNKKTALSASFLSAINIFIILESNEIRSYVLSMTLVLWLGYYFCKLTQDFSKKNLGIYFLISVLLINCHYYSLLFVAASFIVGLFVFKNNKKSFMLVNFIAFLTFLPYFLKTFINKSLEAGFNTWIEEPGMDVFLNHIIFYFGNVAFFIITIVFCVFAYKKFLQNKIEGKVFLYNICTITFVFYFALFLSIIKPVLFERYFCIFLPLLIINTAILLNIDYKTKFKNLIIVLIFLFSINMPKYENHNLFNNIDSLINYALLDSKNLDKKYSYYFVIPDTMKYLDYYKKVPKDKVILSRYGISENVDLPAFYLSSAKEKRNVVFYLCESCINSRLKFSRSLNIKRVNTSVIPIYKLVIN